LRASSLNLQMLSERMQNAANKMRQTGEVLRSTARGRSEAFDRANKGFGYYIRGVEVAENNAHRWRGNCYRDFAEAVSEGRPYEVSARAREPVSRQRPERRQAYAVRAQKR
jgi:hypothetical protein